MLVMGPERLPEVAKQAAFLVRKARQGMYRLKSEMQSEMDATPFGDLQKARDEISNFKNDIKQFGRDLADTAEQEVGDGARDVKSDKDGDDQANKPSKPSGSQVDNS